MQISIIAAMANGRVIGIDNTLPWRLPADLQHFKTMTMGKPILMGRKTYESIGRPLPGRTNVVVSRNDAYQPEGVIKAHSICEAFAQVIAHDEVMIVGGASFYDQMLPFANRLYLTLIHADFEGDAFFPDYDPADWREAARADHPADENNPHPYSFLILERVKEPDIFPSCEIDPD